LSSHSVLFISQTQVISFIFCSKASLHSNQASDNFFALSKSKYLSHHLLFLASDKSLSLTQDFFIKYQKFSEKSF
jgi:hypothetical protein